MFQFSIDQGNNEGKGREVKMRQCIFYTDAPLCTSAGLHLSLPWGYTHRWTGTMGLAEGKKKLNMRIIQQLWLYHLASNMLYLLCQAKRK